MINDMKATTVANRDITISGYLTLINKNTYKERLFIVATVNCRKRLFYTSDIKGMTQRKAMELPPYVGSMDNLFIPTDIELHYV